MKSARSALIVFISLLIAFCAGVAFAGDLTLELTDLENNKVVLQHARAYYEDDKYMPTKIIQFNGVEVEFGSARVVIPWDKIEILEKKQKDGKYDAFDHRVTVHFTDGTTKDLIISNYVGFQYVGGKTDLGDYKIWVCECKVLKVVRKPQPSKKK